MEWHAFLLTGIHAIKNFLFHFNICNTKHWFIFISHFNVLNNNVLVAFATGHDLTPSLPQFLFTNNFVQLYSKHFSSVSLFIQYFLRSINWLLDETLTNIILRNPSNVISIQYIINFLLTYTKTSKIVNIRNKIFIFHNL